MSITPKNLARSQVMFKAATPFWMMWLMLLNFLTIPILLKAESFPILPEFQVYHTLGTGGSNYSSGALGVAVHLFDEDGGPGRYLHFLSILVPPKTLGFDNRVGNQTTGTQGQGFEVGVHDQWLNPSGKGATLSLRRIEWNEIKQGSQQIGKAKNDLLHMGWNWSMVRQGVVVWLFGIDIASLELPSKKLMEFQLALGLRTAF